MSQPTLQRNPSVRKGLTCRDDSSVNLKSVFLPKDRSFEASRDDLIVEAKLEHDKKLAAITEELTRTDSFSKLQHFQRALSEKKLQNKPSLRDSSKIVYDKEDSRVVKAATSKAAWKKLCGEINAGEDESYFSWVYFMVCPRILPVENLLKKCIEEEEWNVLSRFIEEYFFYFEHDAHLLKAFEELTTSTPSNQISHIRGLVKLKLALKEQKQFMQMAIPSPPPLCQKHLLSKDNIKFDFLEVPVEELVRQLCLLESKLFRRIPIVEMLDVRSKRGLPYAHVESFIQHANQVITGITKIILTPTSPKTRALYITKYIDVAEGCFSANNFNAVYEILGALGSASVKRLKKSWKYVTSRHRAVHKKLDDQITPKDNYINYRKHLESCTQPLIPFLGVFLRDLTFMEENPDVVEKTLINFSKFEMIAKVLAEFLRYQTCMYHFTKVKSIHSFWKNLEQSDEDTLYAISVLLEPLSKKAENDSHRRSGPLSLISPRKAHDRHNKSEKHDNKSDKMWSSSPDKLVV